MEWIVINGICVLINIALFRWNIINNNKKLAIMSILNAVYSVVMFTISLIN